MSPVVLLSYDFWILGIKREVHTEIRVFGKDYWFEQDGARKVKSRNKEKFPVADEKYVLTETIG